MVAFSYARHLTDKFNVGLSVKYVQQRIWNETASGVAFDIGTQYHLWFNNFAIGMSLTNFGGDMRYDGRDLSYKYDLDQSLPKNRLAPTMLETEEYPLPLHFQVGVSMDAIRSENFVRRLALDVTHPNDNKERINLGTEVSAFEILFLRGGYRYNYDEEDFTLGLGIAVPYQGNSITFDYAWVKNNMLPNIHRFSVGLDF